MQNLLSSTPEHRSHSKIEALSRRPKDSLSYQLRGMQKESKRGRLGPSISTSADGYLFQVHASIPLHAGIAMSCLCLASNRTNHQAFLWAPVSKWICVHVFPNPDQTKLLDLDSRKTLPKLGVADFQSWDFLRQIQPTLIPLMYVRNLSIRSKKKEPR